MSAAWEKYRSEPGRSAGGGHSVFIMPMGGNRAGMVCGLVRQNVRDTIIPVGNRSARIVGNG